MADISRITPSIANPSLSQTDSARAARNLRDQVHQDQASGDDVLHRRVMQFLRDPSAFLLLNGRKAARESLSLAFRCLASRNVRNHPYEAPRATRGFHFEFAVNLKPAA